MATQPATKITEEEYLRLERAAQQKSEFVDGEISAMAGSSLRHSALAVNWSAALMARLAGKSCRVFSSDMRVRTSISGSHVYPDLSVVCGTPEIFQGATDVLTNPKVVVDVLSTSTAKYDRGKKFDLYREIASLADYVLVHTTSPHIEHFARQPDDSWIFREYRGLESSIRLASIDCSVVLGDVYAGVLDLLE